MDATTVVLVTASEIFDYAAAFFFVVVAIGLAYVCIRAGNVLGRTEKMLEDVDREAVPLLRKSGETLDGVNGSLNNVDEITRDVADMTDKVNALVTAIESALQAPAKKAASFGTGVQHAVSSFLRRDQGASAAPGEGESAPPWAAATSVWEQQSTVADDAGATTESYPAPDAESEAPAEPAGEAEEGSPA